MQNFRHDTVLLFIYLKNYKEHNYNNIALVDVDA